MTATRRWKVLKSDTPSPIYNGIVCMISASDKIIAVVTEDDRPFMPDDWAEAARLIAAAPEMAEALQAEEEADRLFDAADEYTHRAEGEGWLNDPTGSMHVTEAWDRARQAREHAKELRRAALLKAGG